jgi:hypothetical protein
VKKLFIILFFLLSIVGYTQIIDTTDINLFLWLSPDTALYDINGDPIKGLSYYRLKQVDFDGSFEYSKIISTKIIKDFNIYPNPFKKNISNLFLDLKDEKEVLVVLYDIFGKEVYTKILINYENGFVIGSDCMNNLPSGQYIIVATSKNEIYNKKLIIQ